jgi:ATP-dependent DNA helicase RecG
MPIAASQITSSQLNQILRAEENHFLDLKAIDIAPGKLSKFISGFANADGGELYIGIDEKEIEGTKERFWRGFADQEAANGHLQIFEEIFPLGDGYDYTFLTFQDAIGLVLQVTISKSQQIVEASDRIAYKRRGAQTLPVKTPEALDRLKLDKGIESYEKRTVDADLSVITASDTINKFIKEIIPNTGAESWLRKQQLIQRDKPTIAGVLLFSDEPQAILPKRCGVKIFRYKTKDIEGTRENLAFDPITIEGCLYEQIQKTIAETIRIIEEIPRMGDGGLESIHYPEETIHEIVTNALLHRDYSIIADVRICIFDNRIEIESSGRLPGHVTVSNILREQFARNGSIVRLINKFPNPPNKDIGEGLNTAFQAMANLRLHPPEIQERENSVIVYIKHEQLASLETTIMKYLETHKSITNKIARRETGVRSEGTIKQAFYRLKNSGLIEPIPGRARSNAAWCKTGTINKQLENNISLYEMYPEYEQLIINYLTTHNVINNHTARKVVGVDAATITNIFKRLRNKEIIEIVPGTSRIGALWRKV